MTFCCRLCLLQQPFCVVLTTMYQIFKCAQRLKNIRDHSFRVYLSKYLSKYSNEYWISICKLLYLKFVSHRLKWDMSNIMENSTTEYASCDLNKGQSSTHEDRKEVYEQNNKLYPSLHRKQRSGLLYWWPKPKHPH